MKPKDFSNGDIIEKMNKSLESYFRRLKIKIKHVENIKKLSTTNTAVCQTKREGSQASGLRNTLILSIKLAKLILKIKM